MAKFESNIKSLEVRVGDIHIVFNNGEYETTDKKEMEVLKKCKGITVNGKLLNADTGVVVTPPAA